MPASIKSMLSYLSGATKKSTKISRHHNNDNIHEEDCSTSPFVNMDVPDAELFYSSTEWSLKIDTVLNTYATIPLPSQPNHSIYNHPSAPNTNTSHSSGPRSSAHILTPINIPPHHHGNVTFWSFPNTISQSTILGRTGSNACTLIALTG